MLPPDDAVVLAGVMPHAPILAAGVGRAPLRRKVRHTIRAMSVMARRIVTSLPDTVIVISPHSPRRPAAFGIWDAPLLRGSLEHYGAADNRVILPLDGTFARQLAVAARSRGLASWGIGDSPLDHGAIVPLSHLVEAGWNSPTVVIGLIEPGEKNLEELGRAIAATARELGRRVAIIASGEMSHRLDQAAPRGYHEAGPRFDQAFLDLVRAGAADRIHHLDTALVANAAEDVFAATRIALAAAQDTMNEHAVLSYEGPFGVGYGVAVLADNRATEPARDSVSDARATCSHPADLPRLARQSVAARLAEGPAKATTVAAGALARPQGVFVTLRAANGALRGMWGTPDPLRNAVESTWRCARCAAFHDARFSPVTREEMPALRFSVTLLGTLEPVTAWTQLDPLCFGVLVRAHDGRAGVVLPRIRGVDTVADQLRIAGQKGGIELHEVAEVYRFLAYTYSEPPRSANAEAR